MTTPTKRTSPPLPTATHGVEVRGIEFIPVEDRHSTPSNLTWVWIGAQLTFGIIILGWLPISVGLSWWGSVSSITLGLLAGAVFFGLFSLFGPKTGTNSSVSSGAHFGVRGRLIGSIQAVFIAVGYAALTVWVCGDMVAAGIDHLFSAGFSAEIRALSYFVITGAMILIAIWGHNLVVTMQKIVTPLVIATLLLIVIVTFGQFDPGFNTGGEYAFAGFWPTWFFSFFVAAQLPISYTPFANGFARYVRHDRWSDRHVFWASSGGMFVGCWIALVFGAYIATLFSNNVVSFGDGVIRAVPEWFVLPLLLVSMLGSFGQGSLALYGSGLDASSIIPRLRRFPATVLLSAIALGLVFLGAFVWDAVDTVSAFVVILAVLVVPWMLVCLIGYRRVRGRYWPLDLQVFESGIRGGAYWYTGGFELRAVVVYLVGVAAGLLFVTTPIYTGPLAEVVGGVDISIAVGGIVTAILYPIVFRLFPVNAVIPTSDEDHVLTSPELSSQA
jgi:purine-cytosine permease-like protein